MPEPIFRNLPLVEGMDAEERARFLLGRALVERSSDLHIKPINHDMTRVSFRIDGNLQERAVWPSPSLVSLINYLKLLSGLDITIHDIPQEGQFEMVVGIPQKPGGALSVPPALKETSPGAMGKLKKMFRAAPAIIGAEEPVETRTVNARSSFFPTINGEAAVLRILNREEMILSLEKLGMNPHAFATLKRLLTKSYGMILVAGPSGSGKTTTLYAMLMTLHSTNRNIITLEDPVEYQIEGMQQTQINPVRGFTYAIAMRSILRQDPDILMVGEIRDPETAEHAIRASLVGRLVFSTIHANTNTGIIARLIDMGIDRGLIAYAINGVISKRLVRMICQSCRVPYTPEKHYLEYFGITGEGQEFIKGKGCDACLGTGFSGRIGIAEVLEFDEHIRSLIIERVSLSELQAYAEKSGMLTLKQDALNKVIAGMTTIEEAARTV